MLKKLRRKFILITMAMVTLVVIFAFTTIGALNYQRSVSTVYSVMKSSIEQAASDDRASNFRQFASPGFSDFWKGFSETFGDTFLPDSSSTDGLDNSSDSPGANVNTSPNESTGTTDDSDDASNARQDSPHSEIGGTNDASFPVAIYKETAGNLVLLSAASSAVVSSSSFESAWQQLENSTANEGTLPQVGLFYVKENVAGSTYYAFASVSSASDMTSFFIILVAIALATLVVFFFISLFFSKWALRPVEEAWEKQHQFLADASHELKTPLTVILANSDIMLKHPERTIASQQQWVESTQHEALGMQELVVSMLDLAKLDAEGESVRGTNAPLFEDVNLSDLAFGAALQFESRAFEEHVALEDDVDDDLHVSGEAKALERLCATLLDNACKYSPEDGTVTISLKRKEAASFKNQPNTAAQGELPRGMAVTLSVKNDGSAIDAQDLPHVFDRFYRSDKARTHEGASNSYGLGLAIAASTVAAHKGCIMATSAEGKGTTFTVVLPELK